MTTMITCSNCGHSHQAEATKIAGKVIGAGVAAFAHKSVLRDWRVSAGVAIAAIAVGHLYDAYVASRCPSCNQALDVAARVL